MEIATYVNVFVAQILLLLNSYNFTTIGIHDLYSIIRHTYVTYVIYVTWVSMIPMYIHIVWRFGTSLVACKISFGLG